MHESGFRSWMEENQTCAAVGHPPLLEVVVAALRLEVDGDAARGIYFQHQLALPAD